MAERFLLGILLTALPILQDRGCCEEAQPIVDTTHGKIRGLNLDVSGTEVEAFLGIPYATPPLGSLRFKKPLPAPSWPDQTLDAVTKPVPCVQNTQDLNWLPWVPTDKKVSEDCLYLNIWTPASRCDQDKKCSLKPVLIWIHGGGYYSGSSDLDIYDGRHLAAYGDVVVASMNYRLGIFGFLFSGTEDAPGNMGHLDQNQALKWIHDNAANFGGDPKNITIFGQSAGAVSVSYHLMSPMSRGLFHRAVMQSGSNFHPLLAADTKLNIFQANEFAKSLKCADDDQNSMFTNPSEVVQCLADIDALQLAAAERKLLERSPATFLPTHGDEFMPEDPITAAKSGQFNKVPLLIGFNPDEGWPILAIMLPQMLQNTSVSKPMASAIMAAMFMSYPAPVPEKIAEFYISSVSDDDDLGLRRALGHSYGDNVISCPSVFFAEEFARHSPDTHLYYFNHRSPQLKLPEWMGVTHFQEVPYVFGEPLKVSKNSKEDKSSIEEVRLSQKMMDIWTRFTTTGLLLENEAPWPPYSAKSPQYVEINLNGSSVKSGHANLRCEFWRQLMSGKQ